MTLQNRVTPLGELIADPARGLVYGNRGCLHDDAGRIRLQFAGKRWIACRLRFRGWRRHPLMRPGGFTELFFLDEATALAAGHRPCALCRRDDYLRMAVVWRELHGGPVGADAIDDRLHRERLHLVTRARRLHEARIESLPAATFVIFQGAPHVLLDGSLLRWTPSGYVGRSPRPARGPVEVITPPSLVALLRAGWAPAVPLLHPSAFAGSVLPT